MTSPFATFHSGSSPNRLDPLFPPLDYPTAPVMNPITSWIQSGMEDPLARQRDHDLRIAKNTYYATELAAELQGPCHSDKFLVLNKQKDEYQAEIKRTVVEARRKGRDPLGRAMRQAEADVLKAKSEKILAGDGK